MTRRVRSSTVSPKPVTTAESQPSSESPPGGASKQTAKDAFDATAADRAAVPANDVIYPYATDAQAASTVAVQVADWCAQAPNRARFVLLPSAIFAITNVDKLRDAALAYWYAAAQAFGADAKRTTRKVPATDASNAKAIKKRMMKCVTYALEGIPDAEVEIASIRVGTGYQDLATDLERLAVLYERYATEVAGDKKNYKAADVAAARAVSVKIMQALGLYKDSTTIDPVFDAMSRAWTLLFSRYSEVQAAGEFLWRNTNDAQRFVSLYAAGRKPPRRTVSDAMSSGSGGAAAGAKPASTGTAATPPGAAGTAQKSA